MLKKILPLVFILSVGPSSWAQTISKLVIKGPVKVQIGHGKTKKISNAVNVTTENGVMEISSSDNDRKGWYDINVSSKSLSHLKSITIMDSASLTAKSIQFKNVSIDSSTSGMVDFMGNATVASIHHTGSGKIRIHKVKGHDMDVKATSGAVILAGNIEHLRIHSTDDADVNAKHLKAKDVWVYSDDESFVKVMPLRSFYAFTHDVSAVESYHKPKYRSILPYEHSAVLYPKQKLRTYHYRNRSHKLKL